MRKLIVVLICFHGSVNGFNPKDTVAECSRDKKRTLHEQAARRISFDACVKEWQKKKEDGLLSQQDQVALDEKLFEVARYDDIEPDEYNGMLKTLLSAGAAAHFIHRESVFEHTLLWQAINKQLRHKDKDYSASIQTLLDAGAPARPHDLHMVLRTKSENIGLKRLPLVKMLVQAKVDVNAPFTALSNAVLFLTYDHMSEQEACEIFKIFNTYADPKPEFSKNFPNNVNPVEMAVQQKRFALAACYMHAGARHDPYFPRKADDVKALEAALKAHA